jgi:dTDP-glucose pyrophosphorylase
MVILLPAAGFGVRMPHKAGSKELIEVKGIPIIERSLVASCLCDGPIIVVIRPGKEDIRQFIENSTYSKRVSFVDQYDFTAYGTSPGFAQAIDSAYPFISGQKVLLGLPDTTFWPMTAYRDLVSRFDESPCSMMFGLVELPYTSHSCVLMDRYRNIGMIRDKEEGFSSWICAIWNLEFTEFLHKKIQDGVFDFAEICNSFFAENSAQGRVVAETFYDILDCEELK